MKFGMGARISNRRELQLVMYAIALFESKTSCVVPERTASTLFPIIFLNKKRAQL